MPEKPPGRPLLGPQWCPGKALVLLTRNGAGLELASSIVGRKELVPDCFGAREGSEWDGGEDRTL